MSEALSQRITDPQVVESSSLSLAERVSPSLTKWRQESCPLSVPVSERLTDQRSFYLEACQSQHKDEHRQSRTPSIPGTDIIQWSHGGTPLPLEIGPQYDDMHAVSRPLPVVSLQPQSLPVLQQQRIYPLPLCTHEAVLHDKELFFDTLFKFHTAFGTKCTIPKIGGKDVDLHMLYKEVTLRGGFELVIKDKKWKEIISSFTFPPTTTSASYVLRKYYIILLHHYEQVYFFRVQGRAIPVPDSLSSSRLVTSHAAEPDNLPDDIGPKVKKTQGIIDSAQALGVDPASSVGSIVKGAIDGKFDHGYLVTVMVGTRMMHGVLYHVPSNHIPQNAAVPSLMNDIGSALKTSYLGHPKAGWKRRRDSSKKDPNAPRQNRTGYNYFFAEQRARLKSLQPDRDRVISKMIGDLWNKLSEAERLPYQEQGVKDKERYKQEMLEYKKHLKQQQHQEIRNNGTQPPKQPLKENEHGRGGAWQDLNGVPCIASCIAHMKNPAICQFDATTCVHTSPDCTSAAISPCVPKEPQFLLLPE